MHKAKMNLSDSVFHHIGLQNNAIHYPDSYGIEVELEGQNFVNPPDSVLMYWFCHKDGSLRIKNLGDSAIEYVSRQPFPIEQTHQAITELFNYLTSPGVMVYDSYRTSIHVHINFGMETFRTVYNFMTLSLILDELLVSQNGPHRIGNNFCLRARDALGQVQSLIHSIQKNNNFFDIPHSDRYSSINFAALTKFGSIEFRSLECTTHEGRLLHWIGTLGEMKAKSKGFQNPVEVIQQFSLLGPKNFLTMILGPYASKYLSVDGFEEMLFNGMRIAQDLAYCSQWNELNQADLDAAKERKKEDALFMAKIAKAKKVQGWPQGEPQ